jgi:hypothetical protein
MNYSNYKIIIRNNIIDDVIIFESGDKIIFKPDELADIIEARELVTKIRYVNAWLKIHSLGKYYEMTDNDYEEYKTFIISKQYNKICDMTNPFMDKVKDILRSN